MNWKPITKEELNELLARELAECSAEQRAFFATAAIEPAKWRQSPWGDQGGGFWAGAVAANKVLWYNDIEDGFNVSRFEVGGTIPANEYWCNQDPLSFALPALGGGDSPRLGPPEPVTG